MRIIWDEGASGAYEEKLTTYPFVEANTQTKWYELEQLIKEMKVKISGDRSGGRKNDKEELQLLRKTTLKDEIKRVGSQGKQMWQELLCRRDKKL